MNGREYQINWLAQTQTTYHMQASNQQNIQRIISQNNYGYDTMGQRLTNTSGVQLTNADGSGQVDANSNPIMSSRTENYTYDDLNRLSTVNYGDGQTQSYGFDPMGNRLQKTDSSTGTTNSVFDSANRLTSTTGTGASTYTSDADGNTLTGGGRTNTWDSQNRLVSCVYGSSTTTNTYGADGLRRSSTVNGVTTYYVYDGQTLIREMQKNVTTGALFNTATYLIGPRGPEYRRDDTATELDSQGHTVSKTRWYVYDGLGSVVGEVDPSGNLTSSPKYDVYGLVRSNSGTASSKMGFVGGLGHLSEANTGLIYMKARYYDPALGRFESQDPGFDGNSWFVYCNNDPTNQVDANGRVAGPWGDAAIDLVIKALWAQFGPSGVDLPDSRTEALDMLIQASKNQMYASKAAAGADAVMAADGDATQNDAQSATGNIEGGSELGKEAVASFTLEQSEEFQQFIVDMGDIIGS
ncbi:MAG: RHS repeat-associated core domain-containing protein [Janthinobacterium lividum]